MAADVMRARGVPYGVCVDRGVESGAVECAWEVLEVQAAERVNECLGRQRGQLECEVRSPRQPIVDYELRITNSTTPTGQHS